MGRPWNFARLPLDRRVQIVTDEGSERAITAMAAEAKARFPSPSRAWSES